MAACKCRICKKSLNTKDAYCVIVNDKKFYCCNAAEYEEHRAKKEKEKQDKEKFYKLFCEILGVNGITNTALWKEKAEINKVFSDKIIISYLEEHKEYLTNAVGKLNGGTYGKIRYVSVVLRNSLGDYKPKVKKVEKPSIVISDEHYETKFKPKVRKALDDFEEDCNE